MLRERLSVSRFARWPMSGREDSWLRDTSSNLRLVREERGGRLASWAGGGLQGVLGRCRELRIEWMVIDVMAMIQSSQ